MLGRGFPDNPAQKPAPPQPSPCLRQRRGCSAEPCSAEAFPTIPHKSQPLPSPPPCLRQRWGLNAVPCSAEAFPTIPHKSQPLPSPPPCLRQRWGCRAEPCSAEAFPVRPLPSMARHYPLPANPTALTPPRPLRPAAPYCAATCVRPEPVLKNARQSFRSIQIDTPTIAATAPPACACHVQCECKQQGRFHTLLDRYNSRFQ